MLLFYRTKRSVLCSCGSLLSSSRDIAGVCISSVFTQSLLFDSIRYCCIMLLTQYSFWFMHSFDFSLLFPRRPFWAREHYLRMTSWWRCWMVWPLRASCQREDRRTGPQICLMMWVLAWMFWCHDVLSVFLHSSPLRLCSSLPPRWSGSVRSRTTCTRCSIMSRSWPSNSLKTYVSVSASARSFMWLEHISAVNHMKCGEVQSCL